MNTQAYPRRRLLWLRKLRLITGLTLFTYVTTHSLNHSRGNISIPAMEAGMVVQKLFWQGLIGTAVLYTALTIHYMLGLWAFHERRHFGWTVTEVVQLVLGLSIPFLLMNHLFVTRISLAVFGTQKGYAQELYSFWVAAPHLGVLQVAVLIVAWIHGCIGIYHWLRLKTLFSCWMPYLFCAAVLLVFVLLARLFRAWREHRGSAIRVTYPSRRSVRVPVGFSVLEASRSVGVPHASICGGRGRCSTCRIRVVAGAQHIAPPSAAEQTVLRRIAAEPGVRLACQLRPTGDVSVAPLLPSNWPITALRRSEWPMPAEERFIVVLMVKSISLNARWQILTKPCVWRNRVRRSTLSMPATSETQP